MLVFLNAFLRGFLKRLTQHDRHDSVRFIQSCIDSSLCCHDTKYDCGTVSPSGAIIQMPIDPVSAHAETEEAVKLPKEFTLIITPLSGALTRLR